MPQKVSDGIVRPRTVLDCVLHLQRAGTQPAMQRLEETELELANYLFETLSEIHQNLFNLHGPGGKTRRVYRKVEFMTLVCIESLRQSHFELWQQQMGSGNDVSDKPEG